MRHLVVALSLVASVTVLAGVGPGSSSVGSALPTAFSDEVVTRLGTLTAVEALPDGRVVALEQSGRLVRIDDRDGSAAVSTLTNFDVCSNSERGLLGFALDPAFVTSGFVYVYRTVASSEPGGCHNRVSRFFMDENGLDQSSERILVDRISSVAGNHNGGDIEIGNDGHLYIAVGDAGRDPRGDSGSAGGNDAGQDRSLLNGKILRVQRDNGFAAPGNPFSGSGTVDCRVRGNSAVTPTTTCREIFAYGLRNPYRFAFDPNTSATRFFINDVGQGTREEVNEGIVGANYGWPAREGRCPQGLNPPCPGPTAGLTDPVTDYGRSDGRFITGGAFVPDGVWPSEFDGAYLASDGAFGTTWAWQGETDLATAFELLGASAPTDMAFVTGPSSVDLWYVQQNGEVHKVTPPFDEQPADSGPQRYEGLDVPARRFDSRELTPPASLRAGQTRLIDLSAPSGATAAVVNITLVRPQTNGAFATVWQPRTVRPATSNLNAAEREIVANASIVPLDEEGAMLLFAQASSHVIVDVSGFFVDQPGAASSGRFEPTDPIRVADTRTAASETNRFVRAADGSGERVTVRVAPGSSEAGQLPADEVTAVAVTITAINRSNAGAGFVTGFPTGASRPNSSTVNTNAAPDVRANLAVLPISAAGDLDLYLDNVDDVAVDLVGWFTSDASDSSTAGRFHLVVAERELDTRITGQRLVPGDIETLDLDAVPASASAIAQNLTMVRTGGRGFVTALPGGANDVPDVSNVNASGPGQVRAALAFTNLSAGSEQLVAGESSTDLLVDAFGWFE